jgi:hypothetical protein
MEQSSPEGTEFPSTGVCLQSEAALPRYLTLRTPEHV